MDNQIKVELLYDLLEMKYKELNPNISNNELFPSYWESTNNFSLKIKILEEAIKEHKLIKYTKGYQLLIEGIRN